MRIPVTLVAAGAIVCMCAAPSRAEDVATFMVNEYFGLHYDREPVSVDVTLPRPVPRNAIGISERPCQVEVLEGTPEAVRKARVWTTVTFNVGGLSSNRQILAKVFTGQVEKAPPVIAVKADNPVAGIAVAIVSNGTFAAKIPVGSATFDPPIAAFDVPGPVVSVSRDGQTWIGSGYLDSIRRVKSVTCTVDNGPVYFESVIRYAFEDDRSYVCRARVYPAQPCVNLVEDFNVGGDSRFIFNYEDWYCDGNFWTCDGQKDHWRPLSESNPTGDFVTLAGQRALMRLTIWSQFNYFGGKQETMALKSADPESLPAFYEEQRAAHEKNVEQTNQAKEKWLLAPKGPEPKPPEPPVQPPYAETTMNLGGATMRIPNVITPFAGSTAVGGFLCRPDRWTRAKINHVDLYLRPEVPGQRITRGVTGMNGARIRPAMEAWIVDGHREWSLFAVPAANRKWLGRAHLYQGIWPLDRLNRLTLVWNSDGSPVAPEQAKPGPKACGSVIVGEALMDFEGGMRSGLRFFNGSSRPRGVSPPDAGFKAGSRMLTAGPDTLNEMVTTAIIAYMGADDSAYPSFRAMLPWTDPEAINPFYQGMENMNFNADLYRMVYTFGTQLAERNHPDAKRFLDHGAKSFDMALDRYVYPQSGCWEESHGYAGHTIRTVGSMVNSMRNSGLRDFLDEPRFARMIAFFLSVLSPRDAGFGNRVVPPIGDHGGPPIKDSPVNRFKDSLKLFAASHNPDVQSIVRQMAGAIAEAGGEVPAGITPEPPVMRSRWLQGYGTVMRSVSADRKAESFLVLRAGQSWGHHHADKGSMWFWGRNVHFFGDASWGGPPGGTYGNEYKQGPASGTQIEFVGINNWPLPCKYPAPWISDDNYADAYDYANARCLYPYNSDTLVPGADSAVAFRNGYDRQVLFVKPDILIVRDNVETVCPTVWRMHSFQPTNTTVRTASATLASDQGVVGELAILYPKQGVRIETREADLLNDRYHVGPDGKPTPPDDPKRKFGSSLELMWKMPLNTSATWVFGVHGTGESAPKAELLDDSGRVTRVVTADGTEITAFLGINPFAYSANGLTFEGTVGLVVRSGTKATTYPIRATKLECR